MGATRLFARLGYNECEMERVASELQIAKGTLISIPIYAVHRHRSTWTDPDRFDPSRFAKDTEPSAASCKFLPFGAGNRPGASTGDQPGPSDKSEADLDALRHQLDSMKKKLDKLSSKP